MTSTSQSRLKRRVPQQSLAASSPQSRSGNAFTSDDFDLPLPEPLQEPPIKRARPDKGQHESKMATKKKGQLARLDKKQDGRKMDKINTTMTSKPQSETTVASTRARRAAKTPVYVQDSGGSDQGHAGADADEQPCEKREKNRENSEVVEDSHKLSNSAVEDALEASEFNFHQNLENFNLQVLTSPELDMAADNTSNEPSHGLPKAVDKSGNEACHGLYKTPQRSVQSLREISIPSVNEKALRKTPIVHFGPGGPDNQAVLPRTHCEPSDRSVIDLAVEARTETPPSAQSPSINESVPMPPPVRRCLPLPRPSGPETPPAFTATEQQREEQPLLEDHDGKLERVFAAGPVRIKKSFSHTIIPIQHTESEQPPASFRTRLAATDESRATADRDKTLLSGNESITLVDENATFNRQRQFRRIRQQRSASTDLVSLEDSPSLRIQSKDMVHDNKHRAAGIRESQQGLMDSMLQITNVSSKVALNTFTDRLEDVMIRFGNEEDAIKANVNEYHAGGNAVLHTLTDSWNDRLSHHQLKLKKELEGGKELLARASKTVNEAKSNNLEVLRNGNATLEKIDKKTDTLMARIVALRCKD